MFLIFPQKTTEKLLRSRFVKVHCWSVHVPLNGSNGHLNTNLHNHTHLRTRYMIQSRQAPIVLWFTILQYQHYSSSTHIYTHKYLNSLLYMHSSVDKNNFLHGILISPAHSKNELLHNALLLLAKPLSFYIQRITTLSSLQTQTPCMA